MTTTVEALIHAGAMLANFAFNLAQLPGRKLTAEDCANFDSLRKKWDAASDAYHAGSAIPDTHVVVPREPGVDIQPEFSTDPDGELSLDWDVGDAKLSVSIGGKGCLSWAAMIGSNTACGSRQFDTLRHDSAAPSAEQKEE